MLVVGVDATADNLRSAAQRASAKPARGGLPNALFGRLALAEAPATLAGLVDEITILLPWGSLLAAVAHGETSALAGLRALGRDTLALRVVFGYGPADAAAVAALDLPATDRPDFAPCLAARYQAAGFDVAVRPVSADAVRALPTTWAKKLVFSGKPRAFWEVRPR